jgi:hypothetical protein
VSIITILTDFGLKDPYVGIMKGVMLTINPQARIVDITHEIEPQDVREASFLVAEYYGRFPEGTVHLCVVDPTVGSSRKPLVAAKDGYLFVGPDNGLFSLIVAEGRTRTYEIAVQDFSGAGVSGTFHGRDVFAPAAARLSAGARPTDLGPECSGAVALSGLFPRIKGDLMEGKIVRFDRFGNAISNIADDLFRDFTAGGPFTVTLGRLSFSALGRSYCESAHTCVVGSAGYLEFGRFMGSLAQEQGIRKGEKVEVRRGPSLTKSKG